MGSIGKGIKVFMGLMVSKFRSGVALFALFCGAGFGPVAAEAQVPRGVFFFGVGQHANETVLANPDVVGVTRINT